LRPSSLHLAEIVLQREAECATSFNTLLTRQISTHRYLLAGCWSRRDTQENRLVYRVSDNRIDFLQARY
jgi:hypothetical protein